MTSINVLGIRFDNSYAGLPDRFFARLAPTPVAAPQLIRINRPVALMMGIDADVLASPAGIRFLAGNDMVDGSEPIATAYAGHQFGNFVPQLGDGRAHLLGEIVGPDGRRWDLQLKGSGPTPFSRRGDGRAALGPVLREYLVSEGMQALGIPTTRALAAVSSGEEVRRERILPGAILARVAASHVRIGTFQYFHARKDIEGVRTLADYVIARHFAVDVAQAEAAGAKRYQHLLQSVIARQAALIAQWSLVGFIHGVMNTDNMSISGETIDFGPCAFMDAYNASAVFSSIDRHGRYAYGNQPRIAVWNLSRLAETLLPLLSPADDVAVTIAEEALGRFATIYQTALERGYLRKLGISEGREGDQALVEDLLELMAASGADFTATFRALSVDQNGQVLARTHFKDADGFDAWWSRWQTRLQAQSMPVSEALITMRATNPAYIPRNHLVEEAISAAVGGAEYGAFDRLLEAVTAPFTERAGFERYAYPPRPEEIVEATYCGT